MENDVEMAKWEALSSEMLHENDSGDEVFLTARITPRFLKETYEAGRAVALFQSERIIGFGALWGTGNPGWIELGSFFVPKELRGSGIGSSIYRKRLELIPDGVRPFVVTHNAKGIHLALKHGFKEATRDEWSAIVPYDIVCGPCDRDVKDKLHCPHRAVHAACQMFFR